MGKWLLRDEHRAYLQKRGYPESWIEAEGFDSLGVGRAPFHGVEVALDEPAIGVPCRTSSGKVAGIHIITPEQKKYRYWASKAHPYLAACYGTERDYDCLYQTGRLIITEGIFDRVAIRQCTDEWAVLARLSKGAGKGIITLLERYAKTVGIAFDNDDPGRESTEIMGSRLEKGKVAFFRLILPAKDPAEMLAKRGLEKMREKVQSILRWQG